MEEEKFASFEAAEAKLEIDLGNFNFLELPELGLAIEGLGNKIVVVMDAFKSGYECSQCKGTGRIRSTLVADATKECDKCHGKGHILIIPDSAKSLSTTGVVVSRGPEVEKIKIGYRVICGPYSGTALPWKGNIEIKIYTEDEPLAYLHNINKQGTYTSDMIDPINNEITELDASRFIVFDTPLPESENI